MSFTEILILAFALAQDAAIVSFGQGLACGKNRIKNALLLAFFVSFFQFAMPYIGYFGTNIFYNSLKNSSNIISCLIFLILGAKIISDGIKEGKEENTKCNLKMSFLFMVAIVTSIDALFAGVSLKLLQTPIVISSAIIGVVTFVLSILAFFASNIFKSLPKKLLMIFSGLILIALGICALF